MDGNRPYVRRRLIVEGPLKIEVGPEVETCLVRVSGELDMIGAPALERELHRLLSQRLQTVILDLTDVEFIDSLGLACLIKVTRRSREDGDRLRMIKPRGHVADVLHTTGIDDVLPLIAG